MLLFRKVLRRIIQTVSVAVVMYITAFMFAPSDKYFLYDVNAVMGIARWVRTVSSIPEDAILDCRQKTLKNSCCPIGVKDGLEVGHHIMYNIG